MAAARDLSTLQLLFSRTSTTHRRQSGEISPLFSLKRKIFDWGNVEEEYKNAVDYLHQNGITDSRIINLCSNKVQLFLMNSNSLVDAYTENIERLRKLLKEIRWGGHEDLPGLLFWAALAAQPLTLVNFKENGSRYWTNKILGLIMELRERSSWMLTAFSEYTRFFQDEENQLCFLEEFLSQSDKLIRRKLISAQSIQIHEAVKEDISTVFPIAETDESSTLRISVQPKDFSVILLPEQWENKKGLVVKFKESTPENQFKIIKGAVDELLDRIVRFELVFDKIRLKSQDNTHSIKSALNGIFTYKDFKKFEPLEKAVIVSSMESVNTCFIRLNQNISTVRDIVDKYEHFVNAIDFLTIVKLERGPNHFLGGIRVGEKDRDALVDAVKALEDFCAINYIPPKNSRTEKRLEDIVKPSDPIAKGKKRHPLDAKSRTAKVYYNYGIYERPPLQFAPQNSNGEADGFDVQEWLRPLPFLGKLPPGPEPIEIPEQQFQPPRIETKPFNPMEHLLTLVTNFSQSLVNPTLSVLKALHSPPVENLEKSIGYFQCLCFLIRVGCAQLNTSKKIGLKNVDEIRRQCFQLTRLTGQIQHDLTKASISIKEKICVLSLAMKSNTRTALRKIHLNHTKDMEECLNGRCGIMNERGVVLYIQDKLETMDGQNLGEQRGLQLYWNGDSTDTKLQVETIDGKIFDYSELTLTSQLKLLTEMTSNASRVLESVSSSLEKARPFHDSAFDLLRSIADFTSEERSKRFKPEENHVMHRTIHEIILISNVTFGLIETALTGANTSLSQGFNLVTSKLQKKQEERKPLLFKTFTLTLDSNWTPTTATTVPESNPESTKLPPPQVEQQIIQEESCPAFPEFISSLWSNVEQLGKWNLSYISSIQSVFQADSIDKNLSGLFGLETLIGHAILEMKDLKGLAIERKDDLKYSFKGALSAAEYFRDNAFKTLSVFMRSTKKSIRKSIISTTFDDKKSRKKKTVLDSEKSTISLLTDKGDTLKQPNLPPMKSTENWIMCLRDVGSNIELLPLQGQKSKRQRFTGLSKDKQAEVTCRLLEVTTHRFQNALKIYKKTVKIDTQEFTERVGVLQTSLKQFIRENKLSTKELMESRQAMEILLASIDQALLLLQTTQKHSFAICERLQYIYLFKQLRSLSAHNIQPRSKNYRRKVRIEKFIKNLHMAPISVRLPLDI